MPPPTAAMSHSSRRDPTRLGRLGRAMHGCHVYGVSTRRDLASLHHDTRYPSQGHLTTWCIRGTRSLMQTKAGAGSWIGFGVGPPWGGVPVCGMRSRAGVPCGRREIGIRQVRWCSSGRFACIGLGPAEARDGTGQGLGRKWERGRRDGGRGVESRGRMGSERLGSDAATSGPRPVQPPCAAAVVQPRAWSVAVAGYGHCAGLQGYTSWFLSFWSRRGNYSPACERERVVIHCETRSGKGVHVTSTTLKPASSAVFPPVMRASWRDPMHQIT